MVPGAFQRMKINRGCKPPLKGAAIGRPVIRINRLVGVRGFEPPAPASRRRCSTRLSYTPIVAADITLPNHLLSPRNVPSQDAPQQPKFLIARLTARQQVASRSASPNLEKKERAASVRALNTEIDQIE